MRLSDEEFMDLAAISIMNGLLAGRQKPATVEKIQEYSALAFTAAMTLAGLRSIVLLDKQQKEKGDA
jgi:hypothetical protein